MSSYHQVQSLVNYGKRGIESDNDDKVELPAKFCRIFKPKKKTEPEKEEVMEPPVEAPKFFLKKGLKPNFTPFHEVNGPRSNVKEENPRDEISSDKLEGPDDEILSDELEMGNREIKVEPQDEEEETEATKPPVETPERSLKNVPFFRELRAYESIGG